MFGISLSRFDDRGSEEFDFSRLAIDGRYYATLGSDQRVMAFRFFTLFDDEDPGTRIPFYVQETLGGDGSLRGFRDFRFRDNNLLFLSAEYRWEASPAFELAFSTIEERCSRNDPTSISPAWRRVLDLGSASRLRNRCC